MTPADAPSMLRNRAEGLAGSLPPLLAQAEALAANVLLGEHGRRRVGQGDEFWQYRPAHAGDAARSIDWRRSGRSDSHFVREKEWQAAQSVMIWCDRSRSMAFSGDKSRPAKDDRARLLALALAVLLVRGGERVGLADPVLPPRGGQAQVSRLATILAAGADTADYGSPVVGAMPAHGRAVFLSDFMGDPAAVEAALTQAADRGIKGVLVQVLDPIEEEFPFDGRTVFESMGGSLRFETLRAAALRERYRSRLEERRALLEQLARQAQWQFTTHHTGTPALAALLWLFRALERQR